MRRQHFRTLLLLLVPIFLSPCPGGESAEKALPCPPLPKFDRADWDSVERAFRNAPSLSFKQSWLPRPEKEFQPAEVRIGYRNHSLWFYAILQDTNIHNAATKDQQAAFLLGDVIEVFARPEHDEAYIEIELTPGNRKYQVRWAEAADEGYKVDERGPTEVTPSIWSAARVNAKRHRWRVLAEIPAAMLGHSKTIEPGSSWLISFGRYDYTRGREEPVLSSTSSPAIARFHDQDSWRRVEFVEGAAAVRTVSPVAETAR